jgi:hypothetical protein
MRRAARPRTAGQGLEASARHAPMNPFDGIGEKSNRMRNSPASRVSDRLYLAAMTLVLSDAQVDFGSKIFGNSGKSNDLCFQSAILFLKNCM